VSETASLTRCVTLVDDEPFALDILVRAARSFHFDCQTACCAEDALTALEKQQTPLVVTDLRMPVLDGFGVITDIKRQSPATPVIALTGTGDTRAPDEALRLGAWACLSKPMEDLGILGAALALALQDAGEQI